MKKIRAYTLVRFARLTCYWFFLAVVIVCIPASATAEYAPKKTPFSVAFNDITTNQEVLGVYIMPGTRNVLKITSPSQKAVFSVRAAGGTLNRSDARTWSWEAPKKSGLIRIEIQDSQSGESMTLNAFVLVPRSKKKGEYLNGYRIGMYPVTVVKHSIRYLAPKGFIEVSPANIDTLVSPHFRLRQFICKQESEYPKYLILQERLLLKLEALLEVVNKQGYSANSFHVVSGYRTPHYNKVTKNVDYSRHLWGDAADIYVDEDPKDGNPDDLNGDGKADYRDIEVLYKIVDGLQNKPWYQRFVGGLARYRKTKPLGPFLHVDARGRVARW